MGNQQGCCWCWRKKPDKSSHPESESESDEETQFSHHVHMSLLQDSGTRKKKRNSPGGQTTTQASPKRHAPHEPETDDSVSVGPHFGGSTFFGQGSQTPPRQHSPPYFAVSPVLTKDGFVFRSAFEQEHSSPHRSQQAIQAHPRSPPRHDYPTGPEAAFITRVVAVAAANKGQNHDSLEFPQRPSYNDDNMEEGPGRRLISVQPAGLLQPSSSSSAAVAAPATAHSNNDWEAGDHFDNYDLDDFDDNEYPPLREDDDVAAASSSSSAPMLNPPAYDNSPPADDYDYAAAASSSSSVLMPDPSAFDEGRPKPQSDQGQIAAAAAAAAAVAETVHQEHSNWRNNFSQIFGAAEAERIRLAFTKDNPECPTLGALHCLQSDVFPKERFPPEVLQKWVTAKASVSSSCLYCNSTARKARKNTHLRCNYLENAKHGCSLAREAGFPTVYIPFVIGTGGRLKVSDLDQFVTELGLEANMIVNLFSVTEEIRKRTQRATLPFHMVYNGLANSKRTQGMYARLAYLGITDPEED